jgi:hypothetical protein
VLEGRLARGHRGRLAGGLCLVGTAEVSKVLKVDSPVGPASGLKMSRSRGLEGELYLGVLKPLARSIPISNSSIHMGSMKATGGKVGGLHHFLHCCHRNLRIYYFRDDRNYACV